METNQSMTQAEDMTVEDAKMQSEFYLSMTRLEQNEDFKKVILRAYLVDEPVRLAGVLGLPSETAGSDEADTQSSLKAIGLFRYWMRTTRDSTKLVHDELATYIASIEEDNQDG